MKTAFVPNEYIQNATVARIRASYGQRLTADDYKNLLATKSVSDIVDYLKKNTHYASAFSDVDSATAHRGFVEMLLHKYHFEKGVKWASFQHLEQERFYHYHFMFREIQELLNLIMALNANLADNYIEHLPAYLLKKASFDLIEAARCKDFNQLLNVIKHTRYYKLLKDVKLENGQVDFNLCEMLLRSYYEEYLYEAVRKDFTGASKMQLSNIIMAQADLINIINIYRMKNYFGMSAEEIHANIIHVKGRLSAQVEESLVNAESTEAFLKILARTSYGGQLEDMKEFNAIYFENKLSRLRVRMSRRALGTSQSAAVSIYCALYLLEIEIQNIILIIEGVRYGKPQSYLEELVIQF